VAVVEQNIAKKEITTIYTFPGGNAWAIDRSTPDGVFQVNIIKGVQQDDPAGMDVQTEAQAAAYYLAKKAALREIFALTVKDAKGVQSEIVIKESINIKSAEDAMAAVPATLEVVNISTSTEAVVKLATLVDRKAIQMGA
jgi:hypothetical protein